MKRLLAMLVLFLPLSALAGSQVFVSKDRKTVVTIHDDKPCTLVSDRRFMQADIVYEGKALKGCWAMTPNGVFVGDETGDSGYMGPPEFEVAPKT